MPSAEGTARARRSKRLGREAENRVAELFGTKRYPASTGGPVDLVPLDDGLTIQVKAGKSLPMGLLLEGLDSARAGALPHGGIGMVAAEYHRNNRVRTIAIFEATDLARWNGYGPKGDEK